MITETMVLVLKFLAITIFITGSLFMLTDMGYISGIYYNIRNAMTAVPGAKTSESYLVSIFSYISSVISTIYDKLGVYGFPSNPEPDTFHM